MIEAVAWVLHHERTTQGAERLVLLSLADHANDRWECWPSVARIAEQANITEKYARRMLRLLERKGLITVAEQATPDSRIPKHLATNLYVIHNPLPQCGTPSHSVGGDPSQSVAVPPPTAWEANRHRTVNEPASSSQILAAAPDVHSEAFASCDECGVRGGRHRFDCEVPA